MADTFTFEEAATQAPEGFSFEDAQKPAPFSFEEAAQSAPAQFKDLAAGERPVITQPRQPSDSESTIKGGPPVPVAQFSDVVAPLAEEAGQVLPDVGRALGYAGNVARAVPADVAAGMRLAPDESGNIPAALANETMPIDTALQLAKEDEQARGGFPLATTSANISQGLAKVAPKMAAMTLGGPGLLAQSILAGGLFGLDDEGNFHPKEAVVGMLMPGVGKLSRVGAAAVLGKGIEAGVVPAGTAAAHKVIETLGEQAALTGLMSAADAPELLKQYREDPQQFVRSVAEIVGSNLGFALLGAERFKAGIPSEAQEFVMRRAVAATKKALDNPAVQAALEQKADANEEVKASASEPVNNPPMPEWGQALGDPRAEAWDKMQRRLSQPQLAVLQGEPPEVQSLLAEGAAEIDRTNFNQRVREARQKLNPQPQAPTQPTTVAPVPVVAPQEEERMTDERVMREAQERQAAAQAELEARIKARDQDLEGRLPAPVPDLTQQPLPPVGSSGPTGDPFGPLETPARPEVDSPAKPTEPLTTGQTDELGQPRTSTPRVDAGESAGPGIPIAPAGQAGGLLGPKEPGRPAGDTEPSGQGDDGGRGLRGRKPRSPGTTGRPGERGQPPAKTPGESGASDTGKPGSVETPTVSNPPKILKELTEADLNHVLPVGEDWIPTGDKAKVRANLDAIKLLKTLEAEDRNPTPAEKQILARYTGWGGLQEIFDEGKAAYREREPRSEVQRKEAANWEKNWGKLYDEVKATLTREEHASAARSILNAHYTSREAINGVWSGARRLGFKGGQALEAGAGVGNFIGLTPEDVRSKTHWRAVEMDDISGRLLTKLYPQAAVHRAPFEKTSIKNNSQDLMIGNVPFARSGPKDERYPNFSLHNYFLAHGLDLLKPGGLMAVLTSDSTMDQPASREARDWMAERAELVGAMRLPNNAFKKNAGTEVTTDVLFFRKRGGGPDLPEHESFSRTEPFKTTKGPVDINEYFTRHPEMMLGRMSKEGTMYGPDQPALLPTPGANLPDQLKAAVEKLPENITAAPGDTGHQAAPVMAKGGKLGELTIKDGAVWHVQADGTLSAPEWAESSGKVAQAKRYIGVRDAARSHIAKMLSPDASDGEITSSMVKLNQEYDAYVAKHGQFNKQGSRFLSDDVDFPLALALEDGKTRLVKGERKGKIVDRRVTDWFKSKIFSERTIFPRLPPAHVDTVSDGLQVSMGFHGGVDPEFISKLTGQTLDAVQHELSRSGLAFENPKTGLWEDRAQYLSGRVKDKLDQARAALKDNPQYAPNVAELEQVQPPRTSIDAVLNSNPPGIKLGSTWVPPEVVRSFISNVLGVEAEVTRTEQTGNWHVVAGQGEQTARNMTQYGIHGWGGHELVESALNLKSPIILTQEGTGEDARMVRDEAKSLEAAEKQRVLQAEFVDWVKNQPQFRQDLEQRYNDYFSGVVAPKFTGPTWQHYPGASEDVTLHDHQKDVVTRMLQNSTLLAHAVGTGKTFAIVTAAMEMRRLGLARKPMIVVQNATLEQFARQFKRLYPTSRILAPNSAARKNRQAAMSRIATGDWDAVIIPQSFIDMMGDDPAREQSYFNDRIKELEDARIKAAAGAGERSPKAKDLQRAIDKLRARLEELADRPTDNVLTFEQTGVDALFVDEAHEYKKLEFGTQMENIKGLDKSASKKGLSMMFKARWVQEHNQGRNVIFATGTPVSNTLAEAWNMMRFVRPDVLRDYHMEDFDSFASTFAAPITKAELSHTGKIEPVTRFAQFINTPELIKAWQTVADVKTAEEVNLPGLPAIKNGKPTSVVVPQTERLSAFIAVLRKRLDDFRAMSGRDRRLNSHIPMVTQGLAKKASLDMRMIDPSLPEEPGSKLTLAADNIARIYNDSHSVKGAQAVFSELFQDASKNPRFNLYQALKAKLIERGIPEEQIAIVDKQKDAGREALFAKVDEGDIRVIMGGTKKIGTGVNYQKHLVALHHLDPTWRPMDMEQRNGRIVRQNNQNPEVEILQYGVERTLDAAMYQRLADKQKMTNQILSGNVEGRTFEDSADAVSLSFEEQMAAFSGDPRIGEKVMLEHEVRNLEGLRRGHANQVASSVQKIAELTNQTIPAAQRRVVDAQQQAASYKSAFPEKGEFTLQHGSRSVTGKKEITAFLDELFERGIKETIEAAKSRKNVGEDFTANAGEMTLNGKVINLKTFIPLLNLKGELATERATIQWQLADQPGWRHDVKSGSGFFHSLQADLDRIIIRGPKDMEANVAANQRDLRQLSGFVKQPFEREADLSSAAQRLAALSAELEAEGRQKPPTPGAETQTHEMAPPNGYTGRPGTSINPRLPSARSLVAPKPVNPLTQQLAQFQAAMAPQTLGNVARFAGNLLRELNAKMANEMARADTALRTFRKDFDRTPLPKNWKYDPTLPLPRNLAFIDAYEGGNLNALAPRERDLALELKRQNDEWINRVHSLPPGPGGGDALSVLLENYFPHVWSNPARARAVFAQALAKRPLEGARGFLKERTHDLFSEGLAAGLLPVHDNPIDQWLLKKREVERYILGHSFINGMKEAGLLKFVHAFSRSPDGWATVNDRTFQVYGPPTVTIREAFDAQLRSKTVDLLAKLGVPHERLAKIGGTRLGYELDQPGRPGTEQIVTKFATPDDVIWHELGHALDNRYSDLRQRLMATKDLNNQLRALADLRYENVPTTPSFVRTVRSTPEKMAVALQAYLHAPERMKAVAPDVYKELGNFIQSHPELHDLNDIKPSLVLGTGETEQAVGGLVKLGSYYLPEDAAKVVNNFLSPGLNPQLWYRTLRESSNFMNAVQLGASAFHLGFTSLDAAVSRLAVGLEDLSRGHLLSAAKTIPSALVAPFTNFLQGARLRSEVLHPGSQPQLADLVPALEAAGGRIGQDRFWQTQITRRMYRAFHEGTATGYVKGVMAAPFAFFEQSMRPIMEIIVPRQKLGVFADLAKRELLKLGPNAAPEDTRAAMAKAWDSVDNRMGQLVYDNLFYNRTVKDLALLSFRAYGWQLGKYRELGGGVLDWGSQINALAHGRKPELTHRMAYMLALPLLVGTIGAIIQKLATGKNPEDYRDYFMPRTGEIDSYGHEARLNLPSYMKDILSMQRQPVKTVAHALNPLIASVADMLSNKDYWGVNIFQPDDPLGVWIQDAGGFAAKQFVPFSVSTALRAKEQQSPTANLVLPFFGITPVKRALLQSPAEAVADEITQHNLPVGGRTRDSADHSRLLKSLADDIRKNPPRGVKLDAAIAGGQVRPGDEQRLVSVLTLKPLQYQVNKMTAADAMRVWRIGSPAEQELLREQVLMKIANSKTLAPDLVAKYLMEVAPKVAPGKAQ